MKANKKTVYWTAAIALALVIFWLGVLYKTGESSEQEKAVPVEVETVDINSIEETIEVTGWIEANKIVEVTSKVPGRIESLQVTLDNDTFAPVEEGVIVRKGQQIAVIDHDIYLAQVEAARADLQASKVELAEAEREKKRMVRLFEGGSATEQSKDKAVTAAELAAARVNLAKANLRLAEINLEESTITSPINGVVTTKHIDQGNLIREGDRIATIADMNTVKVIAAVAEKYAEKIFVGTPAEIGVDAYEEKVFDAEVYSVYPALDEQTHTIQIEIRLNNADLLLKPGMFARVNLIIQRKDDVVVIPRDVILGERIGEPYVYVVESETARKRPVKIGIHQADRYEIIDGLNQGEKLVINGMNYLLDGIKVDVVKLEEIGISKD
jgi:membrane fusion protein (multidrug efflux system)